MVVLAASQQVQSQVVPQGFLAISEVQVQMYRVVEPGVLALHLLGVAVSLLHYFAYILQLDDMTAHPCLDP